MNQGPRRPVLRYYGGKWKLAPWLLTLFPCAPDLCRAIRWWGIGSYSKSTRLCRGVQRSQLRGRQRLSCSSGSKKAKSLTRALALTPFSREDFKQAYLQTSDPVEAARRTIIRSFMGFGHISPRSPTRNANSSQHLGAYRIPAKQQQVGSYSSSRLGSLPDADLSVL
jgi:DNA adenine methylase